MIATRRIQIAALLIALLALSACAVRPTISPTATPTAAEDSPYEFNPVPISADNVENLTEVLHLSDDSGVEAAAFSPDEDLIASTHQDGKVKLWNTHTGDLLYEYGGHTDTAWRAAFSPDGTLLATTGWDQVVRIWDVESGTPVQVLEDFADDGGPVHELAFSSDGASLTASNWSSQITQWDTNSWQVMDELHGYLFAFNADDSIMVVTQRNGPTLIRRAAGSVELLDENFAEEDSREITGVAFIGGTNDLLLAVSNSATIEIWSLDEKSMLATIESYGYGIRDVESHPAGDLIIAAYDDDTIRLFDGLGHLITTLDANMTKISSITFSLAGDYLAICSFDGEISIWSIDEAH